MAEWSKFNRSGGSRAELGAGSEMNSGQPIVFVVDDDAGVREALSSLLSSAGLRVAAFASAAEFLRVQPLNSSNCLVLDLHLPDISGLDLQQQLADVNGPPIVFISGHGDIPSSVRAMKAGAIEFLPKPFSDQELLSAIENAIVKDRGARQSRAELAELRRLYARLSAREREVLPLIVAGLTNQHVAERLGIAKITVQVHRARIVRKLAAQSVAHLVRIAGKLGVCRS